MSQYFPKSFRIFGGNINVKVNLSNYATKPDLKNVIQVNTSSFALKTNLTNLKTKYNTDKTELQKRIRDADDFVKKAKFTELENKLLDVSNLATKTALTAVENKIPYFSNLV